MKLIVGLGNPGKKYARTRHNIGFLCLDAFAHEQGLSFSYEKKFIGDVTKTKDAYLLKPHTYMNNSGNAVRLIMDYYNIATEDLLVIYDDLDLPTAKIRIRYKGSAGGHNGMRSIIDAIGTTEFKRIKFGIDKPERMTTPDYVLSKFAKKDGDKVIESIDRVKKAMRDFAEGVSFENIMNTYNKD
ncbi:MAG: aminoacyl-tRNA hydrolase [Bacillota bacterium]